MQDEMIETRLDALKEVVANRFDTLQISVTEMKSDVRDIKEGAPLHRIKELENWKRNVNKALIGTLIGIVVSWGAVILTFVFTN